MILKLLQSTKKERSFSKSVLQGFVEAEVLLSTAILAILVTAIAGGLTYAQQSNIISADRIQASRLADEGIEAVRNIRDWAWNELTYTQSAVNIGVAGWNFSGEGTVGTIGNFTRTITFEDVCRDSSGNIAVCPASYMDIASKQVNVEVTWDSFLGVASSVQKSTVLTNWAGTNWTQNDWSGGNGQSTWLSTDSYDSDDGNVNVSTAGQVQLNTGADGTWSLGGGTNILQTNETDFNASTLTSTTVNGTGDSANVSLALGTNWSESIYSNITTTRDLLDVYPVTGSDIWSVGNNGTILHYDGLAWTSVLSPTSRSLQSIAMSSATVGWALGSNGTILNYNGTAWSSSASPTSRDLNGLSMTSSSFGIGVGDNGAIIAYNGSTWTTMTSPTNRKLNSVHMTTPSFGVAVGANGTAVHYNGSTWSTTSTPTTQQLYGVHMTSSTDGWSVGDNGTILKWNGSTWTSVSSPTSERINSVNMLTATDGIAVTNGGNIIRYDGTAWSLVVSPTTAHLLSVVQLASDSAWAVGANGEILNFAGGVYAPTGTLESAVLDSASAGTVWNFASWTETLPTGSNITISTRTGDVSTVDGSWSSWSSALTDELGSTVNSPNARYLQYKAEFTGATVPTASPVLSDITITHSQATGQDLEAISGTSASDIWAVGNNGAIIHYDGVSWSAVSSPTSQNIQSVDAISPTDAWSVSASGEIQHLLGSTWVSVPSPTTRFLNGIDMIDATFGVAVGRNGTIIHYNGSSWSLETSPTGQEIFDVAMFTDSNGFAVGNNGMILQWDGVSWTSIASPTSRDLFSVFMLSANEGYASGANGTVVQYNGSSWSTVSVPSSTSLFDIFFAGSNDGFTVGDNGEINRMLSGSWATAVSPTTKQLNGLYMPGPQEGWAVGENGTIIHFVRANAFPLSGQITSSAFNMNDESPVQIVSWDQTIPGCNPACTISLELRTAPNNAGSPGTWTYWYGASGAGSTFTDSTGSIVNTYLNQNQWVQYRLTLVGDGTSTPTVNEVRVNYK